MPKLEYFVVAESCSIDQFTNRVSVFNVIDEIRAKLPAPLPNVVALASWNPETDDKDRDFQVVIRISGSVKEMDPFAGNFKGQGRRHRTLMQFGGIHVTRPGQLHFELSLNGEHKASHVIDVIELE